MSESKTTNYSRPEHTRNIFLIAIEALRDAIEVGIANNHRFEVNARNLIVDLENERNRKIND